MSQSDLFAETAKQDSTLIHAPPNEFSQLKELEALCSAGTALSANWRLPEILDHILENLARVLVFDHAAVLVLEGDTLRVIALNTHPYSAQHWDKGSIFPLQSVLKDILQFKTSLILDEPQQDSLFIPSLLKNCRSWIGIPLMSREYSIGILSIESSQENAFRTVSLPLLQAFAGQIAISIERERLAEQAQFRVEMLSQRVSEKSRDLWYLFQVTAIANAYTNQTDLVEEVLDQIQKAVQAEASFLFLHSYEENEEQPQIHLQRSIGLPMTIMRELCEVYPTLHHLLRDSKLPIQMDENKIRNILPFLYPTYYQCYLIALRSPQKLLGMIGLLTRSGRVLAINTLSLAVIMAENVSIALEREELRKQAEQTAIIQERQRISRDLHDAVSQSLSSACMIASATRKYLDKENWEALRQSVTDFQKAAYQSLREMRLLLYQLRPISDAPFDAVKSLQKRLDLVERRAGLEVEVELEHFERLPKAVQQTMFIIAQEALNNIVKHAYGSKVWVLFFRQNGTSGVPEVGEPHQPCRWVLEIRDDGEGFDQNKVSPGFGLNNMSERAREAGLGWEIQSQKGKGTTVRVIYEEPHG